ncbi:hypothetical protein DL770_009780 [Monosporascus sp. CRB-9-2]|nr:hypothetical protein DL770_009780 [Monosporascus sp. CRB-9-2]
MEGRPALYGITGSFKAYGRNDPPFDMDYPILGFQMHPAVELEGNENYATLRRLRDNYGDNFEEESSGAGRPIVRRGASLEVIREIQGYTYLPADSEWIRIHSGGYDEPDAYVPRTDAQQLALALSNLKWHPEGYRIGGERRSPGKTFLTSSSKRLVGLMSRVLEKARLLSLSKEDHQKLSRASSVILRRIEKNRDTFNHHAFNSMYQLDEVLEDVGSGPNHLVTDRVIGILCLANDEFLELVYQSTRNLTEGTSTTIQLDLRSTTLKVPSAFGVMQHFPVDWDRISPGEDRSHDTIPVSHTVVILASMRSLLRSMMLRCSLDAGPLLDLVVDREDLVYIH